MIAQIKWIILLSGLFLALLPMNAQDTLSPAGQAYADSLQEVVSSRFRKRILDLERALKQEISANREILDSLQNVQGLQENRIMDLEQEQTRMEQYISQLEDGLQRQQHLIRSESERARKLLVVTGAALLLLIVVSFLLSMLLLSRFRQNSDQKIESLVHYTDAGIRETRDSLSRKFKKKITKLTGQLKKNGYLKKQAKKKKNGKKNKGRKK